MGFPRIRGDVPNSHRHNVIVTKFSPHTRGCSHLFDLFGGVHFVFPAYAGMFLINVRIFFLLVGFPRIRGDVPRSYEVFIDKL